MKGFIFKHLGHTHKIVEHMENSWDSTIMCVIHNDRFVIEHFSCLKLTPDIEFEIIVTDIDEPTKIDFEEVFENNYEEVDTDEWVSKLYYFHRLETLLNTEGLI